MPTRRSKSKVQVMFASHANGQNRRVGNALRRPWHQEDEQDREEPVFAFDWRGRQKLERSQVRARTGRPCTGAPPTLKPPGMGRPITTFVRAKGHGSKLVVSGAFKVGSHRPYTTPATIPTQGSQDRNRPKAHKRKDPLERGESQRRSGTKSKSKPWRPYTGAPGGTHPGTLYLGRPQPVIKPTADEKEEDDEIEFGKGRGYEMSKSASKHFMDVDPTKFFKEDDGTKDLHEQLITVQEDYKNCHAALVAVKARADHREIELEEKKKEHKAEIAMMRKSLEKKDEEVEQKVEKAVLEVVSRTDKEKKDIADDFQAKLDLERVYAQREAMRFQEAVENFKKSMQAQKETFERNLRKALEEKENAHFYSMREKVLEAEQRAANEAEKKAERSMERIKEDHIKAMEDMNSKHIEQMETLHELYDQISSLSKEVQEKKRRLIEEEKTQELLKESLAVARAQIRELERSRKEMARDVEKYKLGWREEVARIDKDYENRLVMAKGEIYDMRTRFCVIADGIANLRTYLWGMKSPMCRNILSHLRKIEPYSTFHLTRGKKRTELKERLALPEQSVKQIGAMKVKVWREDDDQGVDGGPGTGKQRGGTSSRRLKLTKHGRPSGQLYRSNSAPTLMRILPCGVGLGGLGGEQPGGRVFLNNIRDRVMTGRYIPW
ncbi:uncharacterized protein LOC135823800 isoform X2 [Sycon ciliatum]|uniref:uncharacterized protein LOC135823800 isoform X2 n=1 Tax=Sycon ciliatum TaxID=27933 RepID=UPI0031F70219